MKITQVSDPSGSKINEDLIAIYTHNVGLVDIVIFDGATSVSERNYFDTVVGDVAWFVSAFSERLRDIVAPGFSQGESVALALSMLRRDLQDRLELSTIPPYAYPIAAMTWVRISHGNDTATVNIYALGDCKVFLLNEANDVIDLDPHVNPQENILKEAIEKLRRQGIVDKKMVFEKLLPMLRDRRAFQNSNEGPTILCLLPQGDFQAREYAFEIAAQSQLLAMTDGFYRLVDTYALYSAEELVRRCARCDLSILLQELRSFELENIASGKTSVKKSDDASAVMYSV